MPETIFQKLKKSFVGVDRTIFLSALIFGFLAHAYKYLNWLPNWDSLVFRDDPQQMLGLGRWFLSPVASLSLTLDLPWITGLLILFFHALGAVVIGRILSVSRWVPAVLLGAVTVTFPTVISVCLYNYVGDAYAFAFFLSCLGAWLLVKEKPVFFAAVFCITLAVAIYQAYLTVTVVLLLLFLIQKLLSSEETVLSLFCKGLRFLLAGALAVALYYGVMLLLLKLTGDELLAYQGVDAGISLSQLDLWASLYVIKNGFTDFFFDFSKGISFFPVINAVLALLTLVFLGVEMAKRRLPLLRAAALLLLLAAMIPGAMLLAVINPQMDYHNLMKMGFCAFYFLPLMLYEALPLKAAWEGIRRWGTVGAFSLLLGFFVLLAGASYHHLQMSYERSYSVLVRLTDRIEALPEADGVTRIAVLGELAGADAYSVDFPPDLTGTTDTYVLRADDETVHQSVLCSALNDYMGFEFTFLAGEEKKQIAENEAVKKMGSFPAADSVSVVDDVIVIKLENTRGFDTY